MAMGNFNFSMLQAPISEHAASDGRQMQNHATSNRLRLNIPNRTTNVLIYNDLYIWQDEMMSQVFLINLFVVVLLA